MVNNDKSEGAGTEKTILNSKTGSRGRGKVFLEKDQQVRFQLRDDGSQVENSGSGNWTFTTEQRFKRYLEGTVDGIGLLIESQKEGVHEGGISFLEKQEEKLRSWEKNNAGFLRTNPKF